MNQLKQKNKPSLVHLTWLAAALITLGLFPFLSGAGVENDTESIIRKIESLPVEQREQLQKNFLTFQRLPEYRKIQYRTLNENLEQRSERFNVLKNYHQWLNTIPPDDAKSILNEKNVTKKMALIQKLIDQSGPSRKSFFTDLFATRASKNYEMTPRFTREQLDGLFQTIIGQLQPSDDHLTRIGQLPVAEQHLHVVLHVFKSSGEQPALRRSTLIDDERVEQSLAEIDKSNPNVARENDVGSNLRNRPFQRRLLFNRILMATVADELDEELTRRKPTPEKLSDFKKQVEESPKLQAQLNKMPGSDGLVLLYLYTNDKEFANGFKEFSRLLKQTFQNRTVKRPPDNGKKNQPGQRIQRPRPLEKIQRMRQRIQKQKASE